MKDLPNVSLKLETKEIVSDYYYGVCCPETCTYQIINGRLMLMEKVETTWAPGTNRVRIIKRRFKGKMVEMERKELIE